MRVEIETITRVIGHMNERQIVVVEWEMRTRESKLDWECGVHLVSGYRGTLVYFTS